MRLSGAKSHTHTHTHTHTHHTRWFTGTLHRRNGFYTVQTVCAIAHDLPVALLSSVACELAPLRIVLLCVFLYLFFYFSFDTCIVCNDYVRQKNTFGHWTTLH